MSEPRCPRCHNKPRGIHHPHGGWMTCPSCKGDALRRMFMAAEIPDDDRHAEALRLAACQEDDPE